METRHRRRKPSDEPAPAPAAEPRRTVSSLAPGSRFRLRGHEFTLERVEAEQAHVVLLRSAEVEAGGGKKKTITYGVARDWIRADTRVEVVGGG